MSTAASAEKAIAKYIVNEDCSASREKLVVLLTLISTVLISPFTEGRKQQWSTLINQIASLKTKPFQQGIKLE